MQNQKDKRTKDQILSLLDRALEQEEKLGEKINALEQELATCRKKAEDPQQELAKEALASSKISFRIDYYRNSENGPLKGVVEHLSSRTNKSFSGDGMRIFAKFIAKYIPELAQVDLQEIFAKNKPQAEAPVVPEAAPVPVEKEQPRQSLLSRLMTEYRQSETF